MAVNKDTRKIKEAGEYTTSPARRKAKKPLVTSVKKE